MQGQTSKFILDNHLQRKLRKTMTDTEKQLWNVLRNRQVEGCKFRRQHPFEGYILDFVCLEKKLVIEIDGGQHAEQVDYDDCRTQQLITAGFSVLRFWNNEVLCQLDGVKEKIWLELQKGSNPSSP